MRDTFISLPLEQNLPWGLMLRLLSFNGLLIVDGEQDRSRRGGIQAESLRNWKNGWSRELGGPSQSPALSFSPFSSMKISRVSFSGRNNRAGREAAAGRPRVAPSISIARKRWALSSETGLPVGEQARKRRRWHWRAEGLERSWIACLRHDGTVIRIDSG